MVEDEDDGDLADLGLVARGAHYGRLSEPRAPGSPSVASVVPVSLPPSPAEEESAPPVAARGHLGCCDGGARASRAQRDRLRGGAAADAAAAAKPAPTRGARPVLGAVTTTFACSSPLPISFACRPSAAHGNAGRRHHYITGRRARPSALRLQAPARPSTPPPTGRFLNCAPHNTGNRHSWSTAHTPPKALCSRPSPSAASRSRATPP